MNVPRLWRSAAGLFRSGLRWARHAFGDEGVGIGDAVGAVPPAIGRRLREEGEAA